MARLIKAARAAGLDPGRYSGHSLRAGLADLMCQTRYKSTEVALGYLRPAGLGRRREDGWMSGLYSSFPTAPGWTLLVATVPDAGLYSFWATATGPESVTCRVKAAQATQWEGSRPGQAGLYSFAGIGRPWFVRLPAP